MAQKIACNIQQYAYKLLCLDNNDILVLLESKILCLKSPMYSLNNNLEISFQNSKIDAICLWKNNHIIVKTPKKLIVIELFLDNTNYKIVSEQEIFENLFLKYQKIISLNNYTKILLNSMREFIIMNEDRPFHFDVQLSFNYKFGFNSFIQIKPDELMANSDNKTVLFLDIKKGKILKEINDVKTCFGDVEVFCFVNDNIVAMGGDLRDGIYLFDINSRELIYHYKKDWRGYHSLLYIGNNKFLGESYSGRCYGESDDENEELYCTAFFEYKSEEQKIKKYKSGEDRVYALKRSHYIKLNNVNKIAYYADKVVYIENI